MAERIMKNSVIVAVVAAMTAGGCAAPNNSGKHALNSGEDGECNAGGAALAGAVVGGLLAQGSNRVRGAALGASLASLACVVWNYSVKQTKTAEQVETEYRSSNRGQLPARSKVVGYDTRFDPGDKISPGGKMTVVSNITVVQGSADPKPSLEEELTLIRPDGSAVRSRKQASENQGSGAYMTSYSMTMPTGVPQGVYPVKLALFMNGQKIAGKDLSIQVVALSGGEKLASVR